MPSRSQSTAKRKATAASTTRKRRTTTARGHASAAPTTRAPTHEQIAARAHELYVQSGYQGGREVEFWLVAERELKGGVKV